MLGESGDFVWRQNCSFKGVSISVRKEAQYGFRGQGFRTWGLSKWPPPPKYTRLVFRVRKDPTVLVAGSEQQMGSSDEGPFQNV